MAKLTALIVLLVAAMAVVASASAYTTVVTTTLMDEKCEREMQEQMPMSHCMRYVQSRTKGPYSVANRRFKEDYLEACCGELRQMSAECRCDAVKEMMMEMPQLKMKRMACMIPSQCGMSACGCPRLFA